ncbi:MAG: serine/threonine protein kinase, partial [Planctomycetes bacterium]|nr:serine/threonine protein kinase [Planctomycetota bacterium]
GTLFYMAPEQADLAAVPDARWDVYALGALFYHLLCGHPPYRTEANEQRIQSAGDLNARLEAYREIVYGSPPPSEHRKKKGVDKRLADIVDRCLSPDPEKRFPNAQAVLDALELRDRQRARRPLIALGVISPALLLVCMLPISIRAMSNAVQTARANQVERALESDALSARILARGIERELDQRKDELVEISQDDQLRAALEQAMASGWSDRRSLYETLNRWYRIADARQRRRTGRSDASWFLCDAQGFQRWRSQISPLTIDKNWSHRDYFHGHNRNYPPDQVPDDVGPIQHPHISVAYRGTSEERYKVAISAPIWNEDRTQVIGVLARTSELGDLLAEYEDKIHAHRAAGIHRVIALADQRDGSLLYHPWIRAAHERNAPDRIETFERLKLDQELLWRLVILKERPSGPGRDYRTSHYEDPVGRIAPNRYGGRWLAAFCPVHNTGWLAVVQEPYEAAIQPVEKLERDLKAYLWLGVGLFFGLIGAVWFFVARALVSEELRIGIRIGGRAGSGRTER